MFGITVSNTMPVRRAVARFLEDMRGNVAIMSAFLIPLAIGLAAVVADVGFLYLMDRKSQKLTDLTAITAAANIGKMEKAARLTLQDNGLPDVDISVGKWPGDHEAELKNGDVSLLLEKGNHQALREIAPADRFVAGKTPYNAVRVTMRQRGELHFGKVIMDDAPVIETQGIAHAAAEAAFSVGSRLLRVDDGVLNALLNGLLGTNIALTVMDYNALIDTDIDLLSFFDGLASELDITAGTYDDVLQSKASIGQIASVIADISSASPRARAAISQIATDRHALNVMVPLSHVFDLGKLSQVAIGGGSAGLDLQAGIMEMLTASVAIASGDHQVELETGLAVPGLAGLTASLAIGEPPQHMPWFAIGDHNKIVRTAQTRLALEAQLGGKGLLSGIAVKLPLYLELAYAEAKLASVSCPSGRENSAVVNVAARPGIADLWIADVDRASMRRFDRSPDISRAQLVRTPVLKVNGQAHVEVGNKTPSQLRFSYADIRSGKIKQVSTRNFTESLVGSLLADLELDIQAAGLKLGLPELVKQTLVGLMTPVTKPLDNVVYTLLEALGLKVGEADIRVHGVKCQRAVLIQ